MPSIFVDFIGKEVTIVYNENSSQHVIKGVLLREDNDFIVIEADVNNLILNKTAVIKIKLRKEGDNYYER